MLRRRPLERIISLKERLVSFAKDARQRSKLIPRGHQHDALIREARHAETASHIGEWANSPELQPPK